MEQKQHLLNNGVNALDDDAGTEFPLPSDEYNLPDSRSSQLKSHLRQLRPCIYMYFLLVHAMLVSALFVLMNNWKTIQFERNSDSITYSPALDAIKYEVKQEHPTDHSRYSIYSGPPSAEQDHAWDKLVRPTLFSASREELIAAGESWQDAAELVEGGYLASLGVYHEAHCLVRSDFPLLVLFSVTDIDQRQLRFFLYKERYYPNLTQPQLEYLHEHLDHCIESIRLTVMCNADTSMYTFAWQDPPKDKPATKSSSKRICVDWNALESWSYSRMVAMAPRMRSPKASGK